MIVIGSKRIDEAIADIGPEDHILAVWFVAFEDDAPGAPCDLMAVLWRPHTERRYTFTVRTRWDARTGDPLDDRKQAEHRLVADGMVGKEASDYCDGVMRRIVDKWPHPVTYPLTRVTVGGDMNKLLRKLQGRPWVMIKRMRAGGQA